MNKWIDGRKGEREPGDASHMEGCVALPLYPRARPIILKFCIIHVYSHDSHEGKICAESTATSLSGQQTKISHWTSRDYLLLALFTPGITVLWTLNWASQNKARPKFDILCLSVPIIRFIFLTKSQFPHHQSTADWQYSTSGCLRIIPCLHHSTFHHRLLLHDLRVLQQ